MIRPSSSCHERWDNRRRPVPFNWGRLEAVVLTTGTAAIWSARAVKSIVDGERLRGDVFTVLAVWTLWRGMLITRPWRVSGWWRLRDTQRVAIREAYRNGDSIEDLVRAYRIDRATVIEALREDAIKPG